MSSHADGSRKSRSSLIPPSSLCRLTPNPITDSIWLANGSFAVAAGNQVFIHSRFLARSPDDKATLPRDVFEMVALGNGPVVDYHPQLLVQCMLWSKFARPLPPGGLARR